MSYRQVMLYAVRTPLGEDIVEGSSVAVKIKSGKEYCGTLHNAGSTEMELIGVGPDCDQEVTIYYSDIISIQTVW